MQWPSGDQRAAVSMPPIPFDNNGRSAGRHPYERNEKPLCANASAAGRLMANTAIEPSHPSMQGLKIYDNYWHAWADKCHEDARDRV
jgi:hypothetical protein